MKIQTKRFVERYRGENAGDAFRTGTRVSRSANGPGSGSLCDKSGFSIVQIQGSIISDDEIWSHSLPSEIFDAWGPAGCVELGGGNFLFFGYSPVLS